MKKIVKMMTYILVLSMMAAMPAKAGEAPEVYVGSYHVEEEQIKVQFGHNLSEEKEPQFSMKLGGDSLEMISVEEGEGAVSYIYLVDISGSVKSDTKKGIEDVFNNLIAFLGEDDNAALMFVGDGTNVTEFTNDRDALVEAFNAAKNSHEDTNLYYGIDQALKVLSSSEACYDRTCLVILSDGEDDKIDGITWDEAAASVEEAGIPVCCINIFNRNVSEETVEKAKLTGSLARRSPGGFQLVYGENDMDGAAVAAKVHTTAEYYYIAAASLGNYQRGNTNTRLELTMTAEGVESVTDSLEINGTHLPVLQTPEEEPQSEAAVGETTDYRGMLLAFGILAVVFASLLLIFYKKNQKKQEEIQKQYQEQLETQLQEQLEQQTQLHKQELNRLKQEEKEKEVIIKEVMVEVPAEAPGNAVKQPEEIHYRAEINLFKIGKKEQEAVRFTVTDQQILGSMNHMGNPVFKEDILLSRTHCRFTCDANGVHIEDMNSTNGTVLNGVPVRGSRRLESGDIINIGSNKWRVIIYEC